MFQINKTTESETETEKCIEREINHVLINDKYAVCKKIIVSIYKSLQCQKFLHFLNESIQTVKNLINYNGKVLSIECLKSQLAEKFYQ